MPILSGCDIGSLVKKLFSLLMTFPYKPCTTKFPWGLRCPVLSYIRHCLHPMSLIAISCNNPSSPNKLTKPSWLSVTSKATDRHSFSSSSSGLSCTRILKIRLIPSRIRLCLSVISASILSLSLIRSFSERNS